MQVEVDNGKNRFGFRLVNGDRKTYWCSYQGVCYLDGWCAATEYYLPAELALKPITPDEFMKHTANGEEPK